MGLGEQLRGAIERIKNSSELDKATVKEAVKEIQRALISADVSVELVLELSKKIEEEAFVDLPKGITRREHVIKTTYDSLAELMGGNPKVPEKPKRILMCGLFGSGKCVHPLTKIPLPTGEIKKIEQIYNENNSTEEIEQEEGFVKEADLDVFSFNPTTLNIVKGKATHIWKLKKTEPLIKISLDNGNSENITTTPEHPFFVLEKGQIKQIRADELKLNQFVATPKNLFFEEKENLLEKIFDANLGLKIVDQKLASKIKAKIILENKTLQAWHNKKKRNYAYCTITTELKHGIVRKELVKEFELINEIGDRIEIFIAKSLARKIHLPTKMQPELAEYLGYVYGDGHLRKNYVEISNTKTELIERVEFLGKKLFNTKVTRKIDKRRNTIFKSVICSVSLVKFLSKIFGLPVNKKSATIFIPKLIFNASKDSKKAFLKAYFDCDGFANKTQRSIEFCSASKQFVEDLRYLLLDLNMYSSFSRKTINNTPYWRLILKSKDAEIFANEVGALIEFKKNRLKEYEDIGKNQSFGKHELIEVGTLCIEVREYFGATIGEIQKHCNSYGTYERQGIISRNSLKKFLDAVYKTKNKNNQILESSKNGINLNELNKEIKDSYGWLNASIFRLKELGLINYANKTVKTTQEGLILLEKHKEFDHQKIMMLELLANSDIIWQKIKKIELDEQTEFVYDLTVEDYHNFVANNVIVHNTTTIGKLSKWYAKRGQKVGVIAADTFRAAAVEQLRQIAQKANVKFFGIEAGKNAAKVVQQGLKELKDCDLIICDSAGRSALDDELVKEIKEINSAFSPDQKWLVIAADTGQVAKKQAKAFHESIGVNGVIITKLDGSSKGGGALAACRQTNSPVYFVGMGEKLDDLQEFDALRYLSRIMGYGDLQSLLEKAREIQEEENMDIEEMMGKEFTLDTFYKQLVSARKLGPLSKVAEMMGFGGQMPKEMLEVGEEKLSKFKVIMDSMTKKEKRNPDTLNKSRLARVAKGSGTTQEEVRELLKNYRNTAKMFKEFKNIDEKKLEKGGIQSLLKKFGGMGRKKKKLKLR